jgi:hypothetical protein
MFVAVLGIRILRTRMFLGLLYPDPDPFSQRYGSGSGSGSRLWILPFSEIMLAK